MTRNCALGIGVFLLVAGLCASPLMAKSCTIGLPHASCCTAEVEGGCAEDQTCLCTYNCGPGVASCSCSCHGGSGHQVDYPLGEAGNDPWDTDEELGLIISAPSPYTYKVKLPCLAAHLESVMEWGFVVEEGVEDINVEAGSWEDDWPTVLTSIASDLEFIVQVDPVNHIITFKEPT